MSLISKITAFTIVIAICVAACTKDEIVKDETSLTGNWLIVGYYLSSGGPQYWVKATKKEYIQFKKDGTLVGYGDFINYRLKDSVTIHLTNADSSTYQNYFYRIKKDTLIMSPREPSICIEGCSTYYVRVK